MDMFNDIHIQLSPNVQLLLEKIDRLLDLGASHREYVEMYIPKLPQVLTNGVGTTSRYAALRIGVLSSALEARIAIDEMSDCNHLMVETVLFDREAGESAYEVKNATLSPADLHALMVYLFTEFRPDSLNIKASE